MKFKLPVTLCAAFSFCFSANFLKAQTPASEYFIPMAFPKSPNAAEFAKYGDYQVNLYSGLPEISIPLYTVESGGLSVPITLSYHASGIRVNDAPSWVGAGWSVNSGGMVSRRVEGTPDEGGYFVPGVWRDASTLYPATYNADIDYLRYVVSTSNSSSFDTRPDIFSYDIPGHSGKFFFNAKDGYKVEKIPFSPILIKNTATPFSTAVPKFTIQDEHGNIFLLGNTTTELTGTSDEHGNHNTAVTAWMLEKMIAQNRRDTISFSYNQQTISNPGQTGQTIAVEDLEDDSYPAHSQFGSGCPVTYANPSLQPHLNGTYATVLEQDISRINFKNGKVEFKVSPSRREDIYNYSNTIVHSLDTINVSSYNFSTKKYELQKSIIFYKSYYTMVQNAPGTAQGRLRLDSIQIRDKAGSIVQHYRFAYNNQPVPNFDSFSKDYWGFYNGKMDDINITPRTLIPKTQVTYQPKPLGSPTQIYIGSNDPTSRDPDSTFMQAGVLKTIYYPTGGHTTFAYQTNRFYDSGGIMHLTGGLRVDTISSYDGISTTPIVKTYQYNTSRANFMTNGLTNNINYGFFMNAVTARYTVFMSGVAFCSTKRVRTYYSESTSNLTPTEGNPVAYSNVTEYIGTPANNIGKSVYIYRDTADIWDGAATATGVPVTYDYFYARGQLMGKSDFLRKTDGTYQVVKAQTNTYTAFPPITYGGVGMVVGQNEVSDGAITIIYPGAPGTGDDNDGARFPFDDYSIVSDDNYQTGSSTINYDTSDPTKYTTSTVNYVYGDTTHQQIARVYHTDSKGNTHVTVNKYPFDYLSGTTTYNAVLDTMLNRHMYAEVVEKWDTLKNAATSVNAVTGAQFNQFQYGSITGTIVPYKISTLSVASPLTNFVPASVVSGTLTGDSRYAQMISFDWYDSNNNITQYTPRNATPTAIMWDYLHAMPVAQVKNAPANLTGGTMAYTSFEADGKGNWLYSGTPVFDPTAPTGSNVYPLSSGNVSISFYTNTKANVLSYWSNGGAATVTCGSSITGTALVSSNGWTYYEHTIPSGAASAITISGSTSIDELRLYPVDAQMTTYTYAPSGLTSAADTKGSISHFEYDLFQRLKNIKDWNGNIVKNFGYHTYDQTIGNDAMSGTFTRNNCPGGTTPGSTGFSLAANKYLSSTKASANAEANYDYTTNGQLKANTVCGCPLTTVSFTLSNSTGISGFQIVFNGGSNPSFNFPSTGSTNVQVPVGSYTTVTVGAVGSMTHTFQLGVRTAQTNVHSSSYSTVYIATSGSSDTSFSIN